MADMQRTPQERADDKAEMEAMEKAVFTEMRQ